MQDADKLAFYKDYLIRARQDAMQDKASLTTIQYIKIVVLGVVVAMADSPAGLIGLAVVPIFIFALDYLHRMRFEEIFNRWRYIHDHLLCKIRPLLELDENFPFFETQIVNEYNAYKQREKHVRTGIIILPILISPAAVVNVSNYLGASQELSYTFAIVLVILMFLVIFFDRKLDQIIWEAYHPPAVVVALIVIGGLLVTQGTGLMEPWIIEVIDKFTSSQLPPIPDSCNGSL